MNLNHDNQTTSSMCYNEAIASLRTRQAAGNETRRDSNRIGITDDKCLSLK